MRKLRKFAASIGIIFVAFSSLLFTLPAYAQSLSEAQSALAAGQQEVVDATLALSNASDTLINTETVLSNAITSEAQAKADYEASIVTTTTVSGGLTAECYNVQGQNNAPTLPQGALPVHTEVVPNINFQWFSGEVLSCGLSEDVIVIFKGEINLPTAGTYQWHGTGDDGTKLFIDGVSVVEDWRDKGSGGKISSPVDMAAGNHTIEFWYYENGGGANVWLYWLQPGGSWEIVPATAFGTPTTVTTDDPTLLAAWQQKQSDTATAQKNYDDAVIAKTEATARLQTATDAIPGLEKAVVDATPVVPPVDPNPPVVPPVVPEPPTPPLPPEPKNPLPSEPVVPTPIEVPSSQPSPEPPIVDVTTVPPSEIDPQTLSAAEVTQLKEAANETLATSDPGSPEYQQALEQLWVAAEADDIEVDPALAAVPLIGNAAVAITDAVNFVGNVGADMSPKVRAESKKVVISAVVAAGAAISASTGAATAAAGASASSSGSSSSRKK